MSFTFSTKKRTAVVAAASLIAGIGVSSVLAGPAQAIPYYERACSFDVQSNTAVNGWLAVTGSRVTVNNGTVGRNVVVNFNADAGVDTLSEIRVGYRVDSGAIQTPGAQNFANHTEYWQTRHSMVVLDIGPGSHTIQPYWRISGAVGKNGVINSRCLTAEAYTY